MNFSLGCSLTCWNSLLFIRIILTWINRGSAIFQRVVVIAERTADRDVIIVQQSYQVIPTRAVSEGYCIFHRHQQLTKVKALVNLGRCNSSYKFLVAIRRLLKNPSSMHPAVFGSNILLWSIVINSASNNKWYSVQSSLVTCILQEISKAPLLVWLMGDRCSKGYWSLLKERLAVSWLP